MTQPSRTDGDIAAIFATRAAGTVNPELAERIHDAAATTRQRRRFVVLPWLDRGTPMRSLAFAAVLGASSLALVGALLIAGSDRDPVTPTPAPSVPPPTAAPTPAASPSASPSPTPSPTPTSSFAFGAPREIARPRVDGGGWLTRPISVYRSPSMTSAKLDEIPGNDTSIFFVTGPLEREGLVWWFIDTYEGDDVSEYESGWVPVAAVNSDEPAVIGLVKPDCAPSPMTSDQVRSDRFGLECYGGEDITITGHFECAPNESGPVTRVWQREGISCWFSPDGGLPTLVVYGDAVFDLVPSGQDSVSGTYRVTGHFADPRSADCEPEPGSTLTVAEAQYACRRDFVAVTAERVD